MGQTSTPPSNSASAARPGLGQFLVDRRLYSVIHEQVIRIDGAPGRTIVLRDRIGRDARTHAQVMDRVVADLVDGNGHAFGYGTVYAESGNQVHYSFVGRVEGRIDTDGAVRAHSHGSWVLTGGTGPWRRRTGHGVFVEIALGPRASAADWRGCWESARGPTSSGS